MGDGGQLVSVNEDGGTGTGSSYIRRNVRGVEKLVGGG